MTTPIWVWYLTSINHSIGWICRKEHILINLKRIREDKGLTQATLAQKANTSIRAIQNYEAGLRTPNVNVALRIAKALNVPVEEIFN